MIRMVLLIILLVIQTSVRAQSGIPLTEALLIKEAKKISDELGDKIWPGISKTPFSIVLVTDSLEFLVYHPYPSSDFILWGKDTILGENVYQRKRVYQTGLLATFPAVSGVNCIVVGTLANTGRSVTNWMITLLHEHFHQYVNTQPDYYAGVTNLNLSGGDQSGMWMLNYPFPYDSIPVISQYEKFTRALGTAVETIKKKELKTNYLLFHKEKQEFKKILAPNDYKYFYFQLWQEGLATYTEYKFVQLLEKYPIAPAVSKLNGFTPIKTYAGQFYQDQLKKLREYKLANEKRVCIYAVGFAEGLLLDAINPSWRKKYLAEKFSTETYFSK